MTRVPTLLDDIPPGGYVPAARPHTAEAPPPAPGDAAAAVEHVLASAAAARGRMAWGRADTLAREGVEVGRRLRLPALAGAALNESAAARIHAGRLDDAETAARQALEVDAERARAAVNLGIVAALRGAPDEALARFAEAEAELHTRGGGDEWTLLLVHANRALAQVAANDLRAAQASAGAALKAGRRARDDHFAALGGVALACVHHARGVRNEARARLGESVRAFTRAGDRLRMVQCHFMLGEIAYESEDPIRAGSHYRDGLAVAREAGAAELVELLSLRFEHR